MTARVKSVMSQSLKNTTKIASNIKKMKHKKLDEDWFETREPIQDGMRFSAKYLGMTLVDEAKGDVSADAVQRIVVMAKGTKKRAVQLMITPQGIKIFDQTSTQLINDILIHKISFCAALKNHLKVFSFVAQNADNQTMVCHAYLCNTIKEAQTLTVTVAQSFKIAYEIGEEESSTADVKNETEDSNFTVINGEKKLTPLTIPNVMEKRYQRLSVESNPFETSDPEIISPTISTPEEKKIMALEEKQLEMNSTNNSIGDIFIFTTPLPTSPQQSTTPKSAQPITPLRPPPASTRQSDKSSSRRPLARPTSVGSPLPNSAILHQTIKTPSPSKTPPDMEDWDQGFADLALSRTQEKSSPTEEKEKETPTNFSYPPSNPFFSPSNPFST